MKKAILRAAIAAAALVVGQQAVHASLYTSAGSGGESWDLSTTDWGTSPGSDTGTVWSNGSDAVFEGTAGTVTLNSAITADSLTLNTTGYTVAADTGSLALVGTGSIAVAGSDTATISAAIGGSVGLLNNGAGTLILGGTNGYSGGTAISSGIVQISSASNLPSASALTLSGGGSLNMTAGMTLANNVTVAGGQSGTLNSAGTSTLSGSFSGVAGNLTLNTSSGYFIIGSTTGPALGSVISLSGPSQIVDDTTASQSFFANAKVSFPSAGNFYFAAGNSSATNITFGALSGGNSSTNPGGYEGTLIGFDNGSGRTVTIAGTTNANYSGSIFNGNGGAGALALVKNGASTQILSGVNYYTGSTTINAGTLEIGVSGALPSASALVLNGGTLDTNGISVTSGTLTITSGSTIDFGSGSNTLKFGASNGASWTGGTTLTILDWTGNLSGTGSDQLFVGSSSSGLTSTQLSEIDFSGYGPGAQILSTGQVVPVPEPAAAGVIALGLLARRRSAK